jgi:hypothetical protein
LLFPGFSPGRLFIAGIAGSYALGANNISNVVGIFVPISPLSDISFLGWFKLNAAQQLFLLGGVSIAVGTFTYGKKVMLTVGEGITEMSPVAAFVAVLANAIVLFLFASQDLQSFLHRQGLPARCSGSPAPGDRRFGHRDRSDQRERHPWRISADQHGTGDAIVVVLISFVSLLSSRTCFNRRHTFPSSTRLRQRRSCDPGGGIPTDTLADIREDLSDGLQFQRRYPRGCSDRPWINVRHGGDGDRPDDGGFRRGEAGQWLFLTSEQRGRSDTVAEDFEHRWQLEGHSLGVAGWRAKAG